MGNHGGMWCRVVQVLKAVPTVHTSPDGKSQPETVHRQATNQQGENSNWDGVEGRKKEMCKLINYCAK